jgi:hypothetical protein
MRRSLSLLLLFGLAAPALAEDRRVLVEDFDRILVEGPFVVHLVTGRASAAIAHGSRDALDRMNLDVQGQTLRIRRLREAAGSGPRTDPGIVTIDLATRSVRSVALVGPARLDANAVRGLSVAFSVEGSGTLHATRVDADALSLILLGAGRIEAVGVARTLSVNVQGSGDLAAPGLVANNATIAATSSGTIALTVNGPATVTNDGTGNIRIFGRAVCTTGGSAAGQVRCGGVSDQRQAR